MSGIALQLEEKIDALQYERERAAMEMRKASVKSRNEKAKRLVNRLEDCDESIANLLSQAADCLEALVKTASRTTSTEEEENARQIFETRAQEWFITLHEIQIGLRSAVKNLRKAQLTPVAHEVSTKSSSSMANTYFTSGSASRGHSLTLLSQDASNSTSSFNNTTSDGGLMNLFVDVGPQGPELTKSSSNNSNSKIINFGQESKMSLSALRFQQSAWKQLANSLSELAASKTILSCYDSDLSPPSSSSFSDGKLPESTIREGSSRKQQHQVNLNDGEKEQPCQKTQELVSAHASQDSRLLKALLQSTGTQA